jgi:ABC-type antimicrobial peptide transport system permease subunit
MEIVGVVRDLSSKPSKDASDATLYRPNGLTGPYAKRLILHSRGTDARVRLLAAFAAVDPDLKAFEVMTVAQAAEADAKSIGYFLAGFGAVSAVTLMLAVAGIYALVSFTLARRTREIGVRIALGGAPRRILSDLLSRAFLQISLGAVLGSLPGLAMVLSRAGHDDGASWVVAGLTAMVIGTIVVVVSAVACLVPVRRALRIQPTQALRAD